MKRSVFASGCSALILSIAACSGDSLAESDPNGYDACSLLAEARQAPDAQTTANKLLQAGEAAMKASTKAIQDSARPLFDADAMETLEDAAGYAQNFALTDADALASACEDEGFNIPPVAKQ